MNRTSVKLSAPAPHGSSPRANREWWWAVALLLAWIAGMSATELSAHPISVTESFVFVSRQEIKVRIDVFVEDLYMFHNLQPDDRDYLSQDEIAIGRKKHGQLLLERFVIRDADGNPLAGELVEIDSSDIPDDGVPMADLMAHLLSFHFRYPLSEPPEFLTFSQHLLDDEVTVPAEMRLAAGQEGSPLTHRQLLQPDEPEIVRFSWTNPPLSATATSEEIESWYESQKQETLGITSYSSVYSFLYIEPFEVRHEILMPLATLEASLPIPRRDSDFLEVEEQRSAAESVGELFQQSNPIEVDGQRLPGEVLRVDFYGLRLKDFAQRSEPQRLSVANARVGVILVYPVERSPQQVQLSWDQFNRYIWSVSTLVYDQEGSQRVTLTRLGDENSFVWNNPHESTENRVLPVKYQQVPAPGWEIPVAPCLLLGLGGIAAVVGMGGRSRKAWGVTIVALLLAPVAWFFVPGKVNISGTPPDLPPASVRSVFTQLHRNAYQAFSFRGEEQIYDALATSVEGPLLEEFYLNLRSMLEMQEQGGAISRVRAVELLNEDAVTTQPARDHFTYDCRWRVTGTVEHWGHVHERVNEYHGAFEVRANDGLWKITAADLLDEKRVEFKTSLRGL